MKKDPNYIHITKEVSDNLRILPIGTIVVAKKNQTMRASGEQYMTAGKEYIIIEEPIYYTAPIVITDNKGFQHSCALSEFSHYKLKKTKIKEESNFQSIIDEGEKQGKGWWSSIADEY